MDQPLSPATRRWILIAAILASSMGFLDYSALNVVLPTIQDALRASGTQLLWISNISALVLASLLLVGGSLGDILGRRKVFMTGILLFALGSAAGGLAPTVTLLLVARAIQGIGGALMIPGSLSMITSVYPAEERGKAIGTWSATTVLVTAIGPIMAGFLANAGLWRGVFFLSVPLAVISLIILARVGAEFRNQEAPKVDVPGAIFATIALASLTYGFTEAPRLGWQNGLILGSLITAAVTLIIFLVVETKVRHPLVPLGLFRSRTFAGTNALTLLLYAALSGVFFFVPLNLIQIQGYSPGVVGFSFLPFVIFLAALSRWSGGLIQKYGARLPLTIGPIIVGLGMFLFLLSGSSGTGNSYWTQFFPAIATVGLGMGITVACLTTAVMNSVSMQYAGTASGINNAVSRAAGVIAIAVMGSLALFTFQGTLEKRVQALHLPPAAVAGLKSQAEKFGAAEVPETIALDQQADVRTAIRQSFADSFHMVAKILGSAAIVSGLLAWGFIEKKQNATES